MHKEPFTILLVDDEIINLVVLKKMLEMQGYQVLTATNGKEGLEIARKEKPSLILLDVVMPGMDGFNVCRVLKRDPETSLIPVVFITALTDKENTVKGLSAGGLDYISKPFNREEVQMRVRNILRLNYSFQLVIDEQAARLRQVRDAQQAILVEPDELPLAKFQVYYKPLLDAGGDFYDAFEVADNVLDYFVADISGHDLTASFTTSALKALVRYNSSQILTVEETMSIINRVLQTLLRPEQHITSVYARLDRNNMKLTIVNAANPPVLYFPAGSDNLVMIEGNSDALGAFESGVFIGEQISVSPGDRFYMFSDGIIESGLLNRKREEGLTELKNACEATRQQPLDEAIMQIRQSLFPGDEGIDDDLLLLGVDI